jgi:hypothetical protein
MTFAPVPRGDGRSSSTITGLHFQLVVPVVVFYKLLGHEECILYLSPSFFLLNAFDNLHHISY